MTAPKSLYKQPHCYGWKFAILVPAQLTAYSARHGWIVKATYIKMLFHHSNTLPPIPCTHRANQVRPNPACPQ